MNRAGRFHFSIDDVLDALLDAVDRPDDAPVLAFLDSLHESTGAPIDLYVFLESRRRNRHLRDVLPLRDALARRPWLRLGPHASSTEVPPFGQTIEEQRRTMEAIFAILRELVAPAQRSAYVRLHHFSECHEIADIFRDNGVEALFTTDKPAIAYRLPERERAELAAQGSTTFDGIGFVRSHVRVENLVAEGVSPEQVKERLERELPREPFFAVFTHDYELARPEVRALSSAILTALVDLGATPIGR